MSAPGLLELIPESDREFLQGKGFEYDIEQADGFVHLIIHRFELPAAYTPRTCDLLIRLPAGYPNANPDMFWTRPDVRLLGGGTPLNADHRQDFNALIWQRWSRHFPDGRWRPGIDGLDTFVAAIRRELAVGR
jgi:hypothetical protein